MKHSKIDDKARVWVVTLDDDGRLQQEVDPDLLAQLSPGMSAEDIADALIVAAGEMDVSQTRAW